MTRPATSFDSDANKGASEIGTHEAFSPDHMRPDLQGNLSAQLPHRQSGNPFYDLTEDNDTDFPEPGSSPEHSGQRSSAA